MKLKDLLKEDYAVNVQDTRKNKKIQSAKFTLKADANLLTKVWKKVSPQMKKHLAGMSESNPAGLVQTLWAAVK